ncbi:hypothetical protein LCGC14_1030340 [marine sediment metagenome]|uniref:Uncharacterized protein n=1 Tax=marine sediment metagenome TaxID=412755 RepID=A0A0F9MUS2_9ZZZZ
MGYVIPPPPPPQGCITFSKPVSELKWDAFKTAFAARQNIVMLTDFPGDLMYLTLDEEAEIISELRCVYCNTKHNATEKNCGNCGAVL